VPRDPQRAYHRAHRRGQRHRRADHPRPHAQRFLRGRGRVRHDRRGESRRAHPGDRQWGHHLAAQGQDRARGHRRRCRDGGPRRAGPAVDLPPKCATC
jgi:hypothetical protein